MEFFCPFYIAVNEIQKKKNNNAEKSSKSDVLCYLQVSYTLMVNFTSKNIEIPMKDPVVRLSQVTEK